MLGRRDPQRSFFDAQSLPHRVPDNSFYGRMGAICDVLFRDEDLAMMYCPDNGRPGLPPSRMSGVTLPQFYDDVSDREAVQRLLYDLRWKVALNLALDYTGFDAWQITQGAALSPANLLTTVGVLVVGAGLLGLGGALWAKAGRRLVAMI